MDKFTLLLIFLFVLQLLDAYTTTKALKIGGKEANPVMAKLFDVIGMPLALILKTAFVMFAGYKAGQSGLVWLMMIVVMYVAVVGWNFKVLKGLKD